MGDLCPTVSVRLDDGAYLPERAHDADAGADVRTPVELTVPAHGAAIVATGVHVQTPRGCATMIKSKSGLNLRYDITSEGVIDEGFTGEVVVKPYNHGDHAKHFNLHAKGFSPLCSWERNFAPRESARRSGNVLE